MADRQHEALAYELPGNTKPIDTDTWAPPTGDSWDPEDLPDDQLLVLGQEGSFINGSGNLLEILSDIPPIGD